MSERSQQNKNKRHHVYVVELDRRIWTDSWKFRQANPHFKGLRECLYVGMSSLTPKARLNKHLNGARSKRGVKISSWVVERYGRYLRPSLYAHLNPLTLGDARSLERRLAERLRRQGYAVWWN